MIKRILVGLGDARCVASEVQHAVELAQVHGAELTGITLVDAKAASPPAVIATGGTSNRLIPAAVVIDSLRQSVGYGLRPNPPYGLAVGWVSVA